MPGVEADEASRLLHVVWRETLGSFTHLCMEDQVVNKIFFDGEIYLDFLNARYVLRGFTASFVAYMKDWTFIRE